LAAACHRRPVVREVGSSTTSGTGHCPVLAGDSTGGAGDLVAESYNSGASSPCSAAVVTQAAIDGADGARPASHGSGPVSASSADLAYDEDQTGGAGWSNMTGLVGYILHGSPDPMGTRGL